MLKTPRPVVSREEYVLGTMKRAFPSGHWVEEQMDGGRMEEVEPPPDRPVSPPTLTIIGGTKYDEEALSVYLDELPPDTVLRVGAGRGVEMDVIDGRFTVIVSVPHQHLDKPAARKVNVEQVLGADISSPLLLVGTGERVKQAEAWLKRAKWDREVTRI
jgi:hypothetical protein